jgi:hypothetical protein
MFKNTVHRFIERFPTAGLLVVATVTSALVVTPFYVLLHFLIKFW